MQALERAVEDVQRRLVSELAERLGDFVLDFRMSQQPPFLSRSMVSEDDESFVAAFTLRTSGAAREILQRSRCASRNAGICIGGIVTDRQMHPAISSRADPVQAGAVGYISKGSDPQELVRAVKAALAGGAICRPKHRGHPSSMTTADCRTKPCQIGSIRFCE